MINLIWEGWKKFVIPLGIDNNNKIKWETIKHLRLSIPNDLSSNVKGILNFYQIIVTGNKWSKILN